MIVQRYVTTRRGRARRPCLRAERASVRGFPLQSRHRPGGAEGCRRDLRVSIDQDGGVYLEPVGKAEIYLITKHLAAANPAKAKKLEVGAKFEMRDFNGAYKLYDDGRRSGKLEIKVAENGDVSGQYYSDKDGKKYDVEGKISNAPQHRIEFRIQYPRTVQEFSGHLFTGDGRAIAGSSTMENLTAGFYALRIEE